jgi:hypothetical protein
VKADYPNQYVEIPIYTHLDQSGQEGLLLRSRNHINAMTPDAIVVLEGETERSRRPTWWYDTTSPSLPSCPTQAGCQRWIACGNRHPKGTHLGMQNGPTGVQGYTG